jgi:hypothetical protein
MIDNDSLPCRLHLPGLDACETPARQYEHVYTGPLHNFEVWPEPGICERVFEPLSVLPETLSPSSRRSRTIHSCKGLLQLLATYILAIGARLKVFTKHVPKFFSSTLQVPQEQVRHRVGNA